MNRRNQRQSESPVRKKIRRVNVAKSSGPPLQQALHRVLAEETNETRLLARLIAQKLRELGRNIPDNGVQAIEQELRRKLRAGESLDDFRVDIDDGTSDEFSANIELVASDIESISDHLEAAISTTVDRTVSELAPDLLKRFKRDAPEGLQAEREGVAAFETQLRRRWAEGLSHLELQIAIAGHAGSEINSWLREERDAALAPVVEAVTRIHARSCQVAAEVLALLRHGFADGAMSRWRTLHELAVVAMFVQARGRETAMRFLDHVEIEALRAYRIDRGVRESRLDSPQDDPVLADLTARAKELCDKYGESFRTDYGWASEATGNARPTFADIEKAVELDWARSYYRLASQNVHAGPMGTFRRLGMLSDESEILIIGPTNAGLDIPGRLTTNSLAQVTAALMVIQPSLDGLVWSRVMFDLSSEADGAFERARARLSDEHRRSQQYLSPKKLRPGLRRRPR